MRPLNILVTIMNNSHEKQVVTDFISLHRNSDIKDWFLQCRSYTDNDKYLEIYAKLIGGVFGFPVDDAQYNDDGEIIKAATEYSVEISGFESKSGNPIIFTWDEQS